jgi:hypothetical protein
VVYTLTISIGDDFTGLERGAGVGIIVAIIVVGLAIILTALYFTPLWPHQRELSRTAGTLHMPVSQEMVDVKT